MGGFVVGALAGACAVGIETIFWFRDHARKESKIRRLDKEVRELKDANIDLVTITRENARKMEEMRMAGVSLRREYDKLQRERQARYTGGTDVR